MPASQNKLPPHLKTPIKIDTAKGDLRKQYLDACHERLKALREHYGIRETDPAERLNLVLAKELGCLRFVVPPRKGGRPKEWSVYKLAELLDDFDATKRNHLGPRKISTSARQLLKNPKYKNMRQKTLQNAYSLAKKGPSRLALLLSGTAYPNPETGEWEPVNPENSQRD